MKDMNLQIYTIQGEARQGKSRQDKAEPGQEGVIRLWKTKQMKTNKKKHKKIMGVSLYIFL